MRSSRIFIFVLRLEKLILISFNVMLVEHFNNNISIIGRVSLFLLTMFIDYVLKINDVNNILDYSISLAIGNKSITKGLDLGTSFGFCEIDSDCYDGNMCTLDVCNAASKLCEYSLLGCTSNPTIYRSTFKANAIAPFLYKSFTFLENEHILSNFTHILLKVGTKSTSSDLDDNPGRNYDLHFSFDFFGNKVKQIAIDPNGIIHLLPTDRFIAIPPWGGALMGTKVTTYLDTGH